MYQNPRVSLMVRDTSCAEAAATLGAAAGVRLDFLPEALLAAKVRKPWMARALERLWERRTFDWSATCFADALRELCQEYGLEPVRRVASYYLLPQEDRWSAWRTEPVDAVGVYESHGIRVYPESVTVTSHRMRHFAHEAYELNREDLLLSIGCRIPGDDADRIAGVSAWEAMDDLGQPLTWKGRAGTPDLVRSRIGRYPDQWTTSAMFGAPARGASHLATVTGDLCLFREYRVFTIEVPLPLAAGGCRSTAGDVAVEMRRFDAGGAPGELACSDAFPERYTVTARVRKPRGVYLSSPGEAAFITPVLLGESGRPFEFDGYSSGALCRAEDEVVDLEATFTPTEDRPAAVLFRLARKARPEKCFSFRLTGIPLP